MVKVYILLPVHNRKEITRGFVECLTAQTFSNYHLVLVDDGSTDGTAEMVRELIPSATVLRGEGNWWWAGSLQQGLDWLKKNPPLPSDIILMSNDDVTFGPDFLELGMGFMRDFPQTLLLARFYDAAQGKVVETGVSADFRRMRFVDASAQEAINCLSTRGLFLRWDACEKIGGFYPCMLPHYGSDYEYTIRAGRKGYALRTSPDVYLVPDLLATGIHNAKELLNVKMLFSKKCTMNPIYWSAFILLAFPLRWIPLNLVRVWANALRIIQKGW
jgi:GT2 family glycosyltransferase